METRLYLDADSLPLKHREIIIRRCMRENITAYFVADRDLPDVRSAIREHKEINIYIPSKRMRELFKNWINS